MHNEENENNLDEEIENYTDLTFQVKFIFTIAFVHLEIGKYRFFAQNYGFGVEFDLQNLFVLQ